MEPFLTIHYKDGSMTVRAWYLAQNEIVVLGTESFRGHCWVVETATGGNPTYIKYDHQDRFMQTLMQHLTDAQRP